MNRKKSNFYGYTVLIGCFMLMMFPGGLLAYTTGLYMNPVCTELGFSTTQFSLTNTCGAVANIFVNAFLIHKLSTRKLKTLLLAALFVLSSGYISLAFCQHLWQFYICSFIWNLGYCFLTNLPVGMLISRWFISKRSSMLGIALCGGNIGGAIFNVIISRLIAQYGWRTGYFLSAVITFVFTLIAVVFFIKSSPEEYKQLPLGYSENLSPSNNLQQTSGISKKEALRSSAIYLLAIIMFLTGFYSAGSSTHLVNYLIVNNWNISSAGIILSISTLSGIVGNSFGGVIINKIGTKKSIILSCSFVFLAMMSLNMTSQFPSIVYLYSVFIGISVMLTSLIPSLIVSTLFGGKDYAGIYGFINIFFMAGSALASIIVALIANRYSYNTVWIIMSFVPLLIILLYTICISSQCKYYA